MPVYSVEGPDGRVYDVEGPAGASPDQVLAFVQQNFAQIQKENKPKEGLGAALGKGTESLLSQMRTAFGGATGSAEEAARAGIERGKGINKEYADQVSLDKVQEAYKKGLLPAAGEVASQIPAAIAEQLPNLAATAASARAGAGLGSLLGPVGRIVGGVGGATIPAFAQLMGGNLERQAQEGAPVSAGKAALAAVPQTALELAAQAIPLGSRLVSKLTGIPAEALVGRTAAQAQKLADERLLPLLAKGTATGVLAEVPTEVTQQMIERAQAGLSLTSPDALKEYGETAYGTALLGPLGVAGRASERAGARQEVEQTAQLKKREAQMAAMKEEEAQRQQQALTDAAEEARKQTPDYAAEIGKQYEDLLQQHKALKVSKPGKDATFEDQAAYRDAVNQRKEIGKQLTALRPEYGRVKPVWDKLKEEQAQTEADAQAKKAEADAQAMAAKLKESEYAGPMQQQVIPGVERIEPTTPELDLFGNPVQRAEPEVDKAAESSQLAQQYGEMKQLLESNQERQSQAIAKQDYAALDKLIDERTKLEKEHTTVEQKLKEVGHPIVQEAQAQRIANKLDKARQQLATMSGPGLDTAKVAKTRAEIIDLEKQLAQFGGVQQRLDLGPATQTPTSETKPEFGARVYEPGAQDIEGQEQDYQTLQELQDQNITAQAERDRKLAPERMALARIAERPAGAESMTIPLETNQQSDLFGTSAMGQMQQSLRGVTPGEGNEPIYTAEEERKRQFQKAQGTGEFRLTNERGTAALNPDDVSQRLASALARPNLPKETYDLLRRAEKVFPRTNDDGLLSLIDNELKEIEKRRPGADYPPKQETLEAFPVGETRVQKKVTVPRGRPVVRGPSSKIPTVARPAELEAAITSRERGASEQAGNQTALFPEEEKNLGAIKPDAEAFQRFLRSPYVNKLRKALRADTDLVNRAQALPDLQKQIADLTTQIKEMRDINLEYSKAMSIVKHGRQLSKLGKDKDTANKALLDLEITRMEVAGRIQDLNVLWNGYQRQVAKFGGEQESDIGIRMEPLNSEYAKVSTELTDLNRSMTEIDTNMRELDSLLRVEKARSDLAKLNPKTTSQAVVRQAEERLRNAQNEAGLLEQEVGKMLQRDTVAEGKARREAEAVAIAEAEKKRIDTSREEQKRLEAMYGDKAKGIQVEAISDAQRFAREMGPPVITKTEQTEIKSNPLKVLGGYRGAITAIEKRLTTSRNSARDARMAELDGLKQRQDNLNKTYQKTESSKARAQLLPQIEKAEKAYNDAVDALVDRPLTWVGMAKDIKDLSEFYNKAAHLEDLITAGKVSTAQERAPKSAKTLLPQEKRKEMAEALRKEREARIPLTPPAPATSGEALTKSEAKKAAEAKKTVYTSKGVGTEVQDKIAEEVKEKEIVENEAFAQRIRDKQLAGKELNVFEQAYLHNQMVRPQANLELNATPLSATAIAELKRGNVVTALDDVSKTSKLGLNKQVAQRLKKLLGETKVTIKNDLRDEKTGERLFGAATSDGLDIFLDRETGLNEETLLHEAVHCATERILTLPEDQLTPEQLAAKRELTELYNAIKNDPSISSKGAKENLSEFVAEALSNNLLQRQMAKKPWTLRNAWDSFKKILLNMLGLKTPDDMLTVAVAAVDTLLEAPTRSVPRNTTLRPQKATYANAEFAAAGEIGDRFIAKNRGFMDSVKANATGLAFETQLVDRFAGFERLAKYMEPLKGSQMMYYLRMYDQRMNFTAQSVSNGALKLLKKTRADGKAEYLIEAGGGASIAGVINTLKEAAPMVGNGDAVNRLFTLYMSAIRARDKGFAALHFGEDLTEADLKQAYRTIEADSKVKDIFERARREYNEYNRDMMAFVVETGAISKNVADELLKQNDYIPWYRERNGVAELVIGNESPIRIGSIAEQPYLHELVGGNRPILDFMTSSVQNTNMLADMGLRNLATKNAVFELQNLGAATIGRRPTTGSSVVKFKVQPEDKNDSGDRYAVLNTEAVDPNIPADLVVKGMEGIPTQMPFIFRVLGAPAKFLRKAVTASPLYAAKQLFRDSLAAPILAGADFMPVTGALRELQSATKATLERRGVTGGQIFTGTNEDLTNLLKRMTEGNAGWLNSLAKWEAISMEADALTRRAQYNSYISQGLSEMEATLMALESMNFNKRGASPSIHVISSLIPFFNAQIQSLNVLYKAVTGKLPFNERLKIQEKLITRGLMIAGGTLAYTAAMQDDEAYKNATPDQKYSSWFVRVPGVAEPVRVPIPFEIGYIFKALPEALYNSMTDKHGKEDAVKAFQHILLQTIPGGTSYGIPQALRPAIEAGLGKSFYTGRDTLSAHEKTLLPEYQFRDNTSEVAKSVGKAAGVSPVVLEQLVQGYTGSMGLALLQAVSMGVPKGEGPEQAVKRLSDLPVVGSAFQPNDAGAIVNRVYERMIEFTKTQKSVDELINKGQRAEALDLLQKTGNAYAASEVAGEFTQTMGEIKQAEQAVQASSMTPQQKRDKLDELRKIKIRYATMVEQATDKTIPR